VYCADKLATAYQQPDRSRTALLNIVRHGFEITVTSSMMDELMASSEMKVRGNTHPLAQRLPAGLIASVAALAASSSAAKLSTLAPRSEGRSDSCCRPASGDDSPFDVLNNFLLVFPGDESWPGPLLPLLWLLPLPGVTRDRRRLVKAVAANPRRDGVP
jgi:hypothetical protein